MAEQQVIDYIVKTDCHFVLRKIGDTHVLVSVGSGLKIFNGYLEMNESAIVLWNALEERTRPADLVRKLMDTYGIDEDTAMHDVGEFLSILLENRIVEGVKDEE